MSGSTDIAENIKGFVESGVPDPKVYFRNLLKELGVPVYEGEQGGELVVRGYEIGH